MPELILEQRVIRHGNKPFIIAEAGVNYENSIQTAENMIKSAAQMGADAIKFQTYKADKLTVEDSLSYWGDTRSQREIFRQYDSFGKSEFQHLSKVCKQYGICFLSTGFDKESIDFLAPLVSAFKIASADITNIDLLRYIAKYSKPIILSTGASTLSEIAKAVELLRSHGASQLALLHCVLHYPTSYDEANLNSIRYLKRVFPDCIIGYSDHTLADKGMAIITAAAVLGAAIIEKHFTLDKTLPGNDHYHAMDPDDLALLSSNLQLITGGMGTEQQQVLTSEIPARTYARRSLVSQVPIARGERISDNHITTKRPATGIPAEHYDLIIGRVAAEDIPRDTILLPNMLV